MKVIQAGSAYKLLGTFLFAPPGLAPGIRLMLLGDANADGWQGAL